MLHPSIRPLPAAVFVLLASMAAPTLVRADDRELEFINEWSGEASASAFDQLPPHVQNTSVGYINDPKMFAAFWKGAYGNDKMPEIDFKKQIILLIRNTRVRKNIHKTRAVFDDSGTVSLSWKESITAGGDPRRLFYVLSLVDATGIKRLKGAGVTVEVKPAEAGK